jgi:hypothetical protein
LLTRTRARLPARLGAHLNFQSLDWRVDYTLSSSAIETVQEPSVQLKMTVAASGGTGERTTRATMTTSQFQLFLHELKQAEAIMAEHA